MASGNTLCRFLPTDNAPPASNFMTLDTRNGHWVLNADDTTAEAALFSDIMPQSYSNATGVTVYVHHMAATATSGTLGWTIEFEREGTDLDADSFAGAQTVTAGTVSGTSGIETIVSLAITKGANMDSVVAGDRFRIRLKRDVANDNVVGDGQITAVEIRET